MKKHDRQVLANAADNLSEMGNKFDAKTNKAIASTLRKTAKFFQKHPEFWYQGALTNDETDVRGPNGRIVSVSQVCTMGAFQHAKKIGLKLTDTEFAVIHKMSVTDRVANFIIEANDNVHKLDSLCEALNLAADVFTLYAKAQKQPTTNTTWDGIIKSVFARNAHLLQVQKARAFKKFNLQASLYAYA